MNEKYELYCKVLVKTGETGIIVESHNDDEAYEIGDCEILSVNSAGCGKKF